MTTPIVDFVRAYQQADLSRLHMPGHKGTPLLGCEPWDITEIKGADELYEAEGIIAESEANATALFGTQHTYYATEGSSQCIRAMLYLALQAAHHGNGQGNARPLVLAARNAHKAFLYACALLDVDAAWLWPEEEWETGEASLCSCPVSPRQLRRELEALAQQGRKPFAVYVTSPDYLGGMQDVAALAAVCRAYDLPLLVDNAHGAYLPFLPPENQNLQTGKLAHPVALGAAMCCDSGHKTLPVLTGGAYLQLGPNAPIQDEAAVRGALCLFGSTSPSYLILQSLDRCNRYLAEGGRERYAACAARVAALREAINACAKGLVLARPTDEPLKLVLDGAALHMTGQALAERLRRHKVECEYADCRFVVLMFTPENSERDDARILETVQEAAREAQKNGAENSDHLPAAQDEATAFAALAEAVKAAAPRCTIRQAVFARQERIPVEQSLGRVCALPTVACPPAIPIAVSGEEIGAAALELFRRYGIENVAVVK
jgi:arginine/lysine/ornithine decarboxylase